MTIIVTGATGPELLSFAKAMRMASAVEAITDASRVRCTMCCVSTGTPGRSRRIGTI